MKITRRDFILASALGVGALASGKWLKSKTQKRDNIILFIGDDLRYDAFDILKKYAGFENAWLESDPSWITFKNNFVTTSICPVSRASIYLGQTAGQHQIWSFSEEYQPGQFLASFPALLKKMGYHTGFIGKWGSPIQESCTQHFDYWDGYKHETIYIDPKSGKHKTDIQTESALKFLKNAPEPYCLVLAYGAAHNPLIPQNHHYENLSKMDVNGLMRDIGTSNVLENRFFEDIKPYYLMKNVKKERLGERIKLYFALCAGLSESLHTITSSLIKTNQYDRCNIMVTSDNGMMLGDHGIFGKQNMYEASIRTPLYIKPSKRLQTSKNSPIAELTLNIDIAPTILEMATSTPHKKMSGASMLPLMHDKKTSWREEFFYEYKMDAEDTNLICYGIRHKDWKYVSYRSKTAPKTEEQFFDLVKDPSEKNNIITKISAERLRGLREKLYTYENPKNV